MKYAVIEQAKDVYPVSRLCEFLGVSQLSPCSFFYSIPRHSHTPFYRGNSISSMTRSIVLTNHKGGVGKRKKLDLLAVPEDKPETVSDVRPLAPKRRQTETDEHVPQQLAMF